MNKAGNRRTQDTDARIVEAVFSIMREKKKPAGRVTVREICEAAGIHRTTFYAHYQDVFDVLEREEKRMSERLTRSFLETLESGGRSAECFESLFSFIGENRAFYELFFTETHRSGVIGVAWELITAHTGRERLRARVAMTEEEMIYHGIFFLQGLTGMVRRWVLNGCQETPRQLVEILRRQVTVQEGMTLW